MYLHVFLFLGFGLFGHFMKKGHGVFLSTQPSPGHVVFIQSHQLKAQKEKQFVFSQWTGMLNSVQMSLNQSCIQILDIDSGCKDNTVKDFNTYPEIWCLSCRTVKNILECFFFVCFLLFFPLHTNIIFSFCHEGISNKAILKSL